MIKQITSISFTLLLSIQFLRAQDNVGIGTLTPNIHAILELQTDNKGLLIPRMTSSERNAIAGLGLNEQSLLVFDTDMELFYYWDGIQWIAFPLDNDINNELQTLSLVNDSLQISNGNIIDLSSLLNNTDDQNLSFNNDTLYIEDGNFVYLPDMVDDADNDPMNEIQDLSWQNDSVRISDGLGVDMSVYRDNTDDQNLSFNNDTLTIEDGNAVYIGGSVNTDNQNLSWQNDSILISNGLGVDMSTYRDNTDDQNLSFNNDTLTIEDGNAVYIGGSVNTDNQNLSWQNDSILISNGLGVDMSTYRDNTDDQLLSFSNDSLSIEDGNTVYIPDMVNDADADPSNELQNLTYSNDSISISNGNSIYLGTSSGSDDQNLTGANLNASNILTIDIENGSSTSVDLSSLAGGGSNIDDHDWYEYGSTNIPNNINDHLTTGGKVNIGNNTDNSYSLNVYRNLQISEDFGNTGFFRGILAGDSNALNTGLASLTVGNNNQGSGVVRYILGDNNYGVGSADGVNFILGNLDSVTTSGFNNFAFNAGIENRIQTSGSDNISILYGMKNKIFASGNRRYLQTFGHDNLMNHSGVENFGVITGRNNWLRHSGVGNIAFVMGENNYVAFPDEAYVIGRNDSVGNGDGNYVLGSDITIGPHGEFNTLVGNNLKVEQHEDYNMMFGRKAYSDFDGTMVLTDGYNGATILNTQANNAFYARFAGGYTLYSNHALNAGVTLAAGGGAWAAVSDKNMKENFKSINKQEILDAIESFDIYNWNYITQDENIRHIGPFAQDFHKAFGLGTSNKKIVTSDISGVNMVAIQALRENQVHLENKVADLEAKVAKLEAMVETLLNKK